MSLVEMSFAAGIVIIAIIIIRALFLNDLPKETFPILWVIVLVRLLLPFSLNTQYSLTTFLLQPFTTESSVFEAGFVYREGGAVESQLLSYSQVSPPVLEVESNLQNVGTENGVFEGGAGLQSVAAGSVSEAIVVNWFFVIWVAGTVLCACFFIFGFWKSLQKIKCAIPVESEFFESWKKDQGLKRSVQILVSDQITTPLTIGIFKPRIVLSEGMDLQDELTLGYVLAHEFYHIKRVDALWKIVAAGVACLHWFNPLVWIAFVLANRDLEITCDAWVVKKFGKGAKKTYAYALVSMIEYQNEFTPFYSNFARHAIRERVESIVKTKKVTWLRIGVAAVLIGVLTVNAFATSEADATELDFKINEPSVEIIPNRDWSRSEIAETFAEVSTGDMTFRVGDLSLGVLGGADFALEEGDLSAVEAAVLVARTIYEDLGISVDGAVFDMFGFQRIFDDEQWKGNTWTGWIITPEFLNSLDMQDILFGFTVYADTGEVTYASFTKVSVENMTFKFGDISFGGRYEFTFGDKNFVLPVGHFSNEDVTTFLAKEIYEELGICLNNTIFDIFALYYRRESRYLWTGWIVHPEHLFTSRADGDPTIWFYFMVYADTGEIRSITHFHDNGVTSYDREWNVEVWD